MSIPLWIDPPLPCFTFRPTEDEPYRRCGRPAGVALADPLPDGTWLLTPICRECMTAMGRVYGVVDAPTPETP